MMRPATIFPEQRRRGNGLARADEGSRGGIRAGFGFLF
jgi:hypothetical protein